MLNNIFEPIRVNNKFYNPMFSNSPMQASEFTEQNYEYNNPFETFVNSPLQANEFHALECENYQNQAYPNDVPDFGGTPFAADIYQIARNNNNYRTALWTGEQLQLTLMSIPVGDDVGMEIHPDNTQFFYVEEGQGLVQTGDEPDQMSFSQIVSENFIILIPSGLWHNITNVGNKPLKLFSIYAPPHHPFGTVQQTKEIAMASE